MIPFFIIFVTFVLLVTLQIRRSTKAQEDVERQFWQREQEANHVRRKDLSALDYITLPMDLIPGTLHTEAEEALLHMDQVSMLNLTPFTNTDLKLQYGAANLEQLSKYESAYVDMIHQITIYSRELLEAGDTESARKLLSYAVDCGDDSQGIYIPLAQIYKDTEDPEALAELVKSAGKLETIGAPSLLARLRQIAETS